MEPWPVATATVTLSNVDIIKTEHLQKYKVLLQEYYVNSLKMSRSQSPSISIYFISSTLDNIITFNKLINLVTLCFITEEEGS